MNERKLTEELFKGLSYLNGSEGEFDSVKALRHFLNVMPYNANYLKDELGISIDSLCMMANYLSMFQEKPAAKEIEFDHNSILDSFRAAINGSGSACLNMFMFTISEIDRALSKKEKLLINENIGGFYLNKGMEYGSYEAQYRMGLALLAGDFGVINPMWAIDILNDLKLKNGLIEDYEIDHLIELAKGLINKKLE